MSESTCFQKAWSQLLEEEVADDELPNWDENTPQMDAMRGTRKGTRYAGIMTEAKNTGDLVEDQQFDTWEEAEQWVRERLMTYNQGQGDIGESEIMLHPYTAMQYQDFWNTIDDVYLGTVWERE